MEAQRYPTDFSGIIAGAPAFNQTTLNAFEEAYLATIDFRPDGTTIMPASRSPRCTRRSSRNAPTPDCGTRPSRTHATARSIRSPSSAPVPSDTASCLTPGQVGVVGKAYAGVTAPDGTRLYTGGMPYGSELKWSGLLIPQDGQNQAPVQFIGIGLSFLRYLVPPQPQPNLQLTADLFTVENLRKAQQTVSPIYDSTNLDLRAFAAAGGKLIHWPGLADQNIPRVGSIAYHRAVVDTTGQTAVDSPAAAASSLVAADGCGPSWAAVSASVSGPRELLSTTWWPASTASRATVVPMLPIPTNSHSRHPEFPS
jgi:hypothetical protein